MSHHSKLLFAIVVTVLSATSAPAQDRAKACIAAVASQMGFPPAAIQTSTGPRLPTGNAVINWRATPDRDEVRGYCEVSLSGRVINLQTGNYGGAIAGGATNHPAASETNGAYEQACRDQAAQRLHENSTAVTAEITGPVTNRTRVNWKTDAGRKGFCVLDQTFSMVDFQESGKGTTAGFNAGHYNDNPYYGNPYYYDPYYNPYRDPYYNDGYHGGALNNFRRLRLDTAGQGSFNGLGQNAAVTRGSLDTQSGRSAVSLSGEGFRISLYGDIVQSNADRDFVLRITATDRGNATGSASIRLSNDRSEVESISVNGRLFNGALFTGSFTR